MKQMNPEPLVSVIIPAYNHEDYIEECLLSVINQTYKNIEIIIINDGSTDETEKEILKIIDSTDKEICYSSQENQGVCKTLNIGLKAASGKYIAILASDDMWATHRIEKQVSHLEKHKHVGFVFSDSKIIFDRKISNIKFSDYKLKLNTLFTETNFSRNIYYDLLTGNFICAATVLIRKEALEQVGEFDVNIDFEDYDMWLRLSKEYDASYIPEVLALYRMHGNNLSNDSLLMAKGNIKTITKQFKQEPLSKKPFKRFSIAGKFVFNVLTNRLNKNIMKKNQMEK